jgi:ribosomal protein L28
MKIAVTIKILTRNCVLLSQLPAQSHSQQASKKKTSQLIKTKSYFKSNLYKKRHLTQENDNTQELTSFILST